MQKHERADVKELYRPVSQFFGTRCVTYIRLLKFRALSREGRAKIQQLPKDKGRNQDVYACLRVRGSH